MQLLIQQHSILETINVIKFRYNIKFLSSMHKKQNSINKLLEFLTLLWRLHSTIFFLEKIDCLKNSTVLNTVHAINVKFYDFSNEKKWNNKTIL